MRTLTCVVLFLMSGCIGREIHKRGGSEDSWEKAPTLRDVPDKVDPFEKTDLDKKEKELTEIYNKNPI